MVIILIANLNSFYEGDFTLSGGSGTGLVVRARFEALTDQNGNIGNTKYKILGIINAGENYAIGDELSFPDQGGYTFSQMGNLIRLLTTDFGTNDDAGLCDITEPNQDIPEDVIPDDSNPRILMKIQFLRLILLERMMSLLIFL